MKLNPPASSSDSDIAAARQLARRLHHLARGSSEPPPEPAPAPAPARPVPPPLPPRPRRAASRPEPPPVRDEPLVDVLDVPGPEAAGDPLAELGAETDPGFPGLANDLGGVGGEALGEDAAEDLVGGYESDGAAPYDPTAPGGLEDVVAEVESPDPLATCVVLAGAYGGMLIDARGQVYAVHGEWPDPGPEVIASKLVPAMDRALAGAPMRSVSVPVGGRYVTAWRVKTAGGLVTVAFVAEAQLSADLRQPIDQQVQAGAV